MKVLGITGGVGAGKSTILAYLNRRYHARIIEADKVGHFLMEPGQKVYYHIVETFGSGILRGDQSIDRQKLGKLVFDDQEKLVKLNSLVHPAVKEYIASEIEKERKEGKVPFVAVEAALLIEDHYDTICDELWYIYVEDAVRRNRLYYSRGYDNKKIDEIIAAQLPKEMFLKACDRVIDNSGIFAETMIQIDQIVKEL